MMRGLLSMYLPSYPRALVYMLQNTEYRVVPYVRWYWRTNDFSTIEYRRTLQRTMAARLLLLVLEIGMLLEVVVGAYLIYLSFLSPMPGYREFGAALIIAYPVIWAALLVLPLELARLLIITPRNKLRIKRSEHLFRNHPGEKIAIVGSYGKTSMKELLLAVLGSGKKVAATPANKNVAISHAAFTRKLKGDEDILLIEYGEEKPGDVARFACTTHPSRAVITGVAAAHLDHYGTTHEAGRDIFSVADSIADKAHVYVNNESSAAETFIRHEYQAYDQHGALGWTVKHVKVDIAGLDFTLRKGSKSLKLHSGLLGRHNLGPLSLAVALAMEFGIAEGKIQAAVAATKPYEHRMQPYQLGGAWIIDDTYNGNIEGIRAGTALLKELPAKHKWYITPGLVDQGDESESIHKEMGRLIAGSGADVVVLMQNSVTTYIEAGVKDAGFKGELRIEAKPLEFYTNLGQFVAAGDLALLQNDWPDNYA